MTEQTEIMEVAVRIACNTADLHLTCTHPNCKCKAFPLGVKAAIEFWVKHANGEQEDKK
jgi:hypothetical protein